MSDELVLDVYEAVGQVRNVPLPDGAALVVGRVKTCDVVLLSNGVSREHCKVTRRGDTVEVENLSSTKAGTTIGGKKVDGTARLRPGAELAMGESVIILRVAAAAPAASKKQKEPKESDRQRERAAAREPEEPETEPSDSAPASAVSDASDAAQASDLAPASDVAPASDDPDAAGAADDPAEARAEATRAFVKKKQLERTIRLVTGLVFLAALSGTAAWFGLRFALEQQGGGTTPGGGGETTPTVTDVVHEGANPDRAWSALRELPPDQVAAGLLAFADRFTDDARAADARFFAERLDVAARAGAGNAGKAGRAEAAGEALRAEVRRLREAGQLSRASALLDLAATVAPGSALARTVGAEQGAVLEATAVAVEELATQARELGQRLGPVQAIMHVLEARGRLRGLAHDEALDALVAGLEEQAAQALQARLGPERELSPRATTVEKEGTDAALRFDFETAWARLDELLTLGLDDEARLRAHWLRHQVRGLEELFQALLAAAQGPAEQRPTLTIRGDLKARLKSADGKTVVLAPVVERGEGELKWAWTRVTPYQAQELMALLGVNDLRLTIAKAFHAFSTGLEDVGVEQLVLLASSRKKHQGEVFSFYALMSGVPMPEGGFVVFQGRLVTPAERDRVLAAKEAAKQAALELAQESREATEQRRLALLVQKVLALMAEGNYEVGRAALAKIAERHGDMPGVGDVAKRWLGSPILRRRDMRASKQLGSNGPSSNRLDIYFMGDGFLLSDQRQLQFDRYADQSMKFCQLQDFFKEYDQFINYWACNTASKQEGLTKDNEPKDTALHGQINGGVYTIQDRANAFALCENLFPDEHDRLVVGIGNDFANVATGGGGIVACAKTMLVAVPHEIGHAFGGLGDEYDHDPTGGAAPPSAPGRVPASVLAPNLVGGNRRDEMLEIAPWKDWLDPTGQKNWTGKPIDLFEGGNRQPKDVWRPQVACVMRDVGSPFCAPCMERMVLNLYQFVRPIDQVWPAEAELTAGKEEILLRVLVMKPKTHDLFVHWRRKSVGAPRPETGDDDGQDPTGTREREGGARLGPDGKPEVKDISGRLTTDGTHFIHFIKIKPKDLEPGRYEFSAEVWDPTPWVLEKNRESLRQTRTWIVTVPPRAE